MNDIHWTLVFVRDAIGVEGLILCGGVIVIIITLYIRQWIEEAQIARLTTVNQEEQERTTNTNSSPL